MNNTYKLLIGDCIDSMKSLPEKSVHCCVTSPPYFGLRDYGVNGQIGLEQTPDAYISAMVEVFREVKRVLRDDGTLWVNIGDSYGKGKQLLGIPWMLALALQSDGWCLRQDIIWNKTNPMPESVKDRCTRSHEYIFLLSKNTKYYFDSEAMKEDAVGGQTGKAASFRREGSKREQAIPNQGYGTHRHDRDDVSYNGEKRNRRSVWNVATRPYSGAHFAVFPPALIEPCILAGCPEGGTVLDPFGGSGTTAGVAIKHGRSAILCELNPEYACLVDARIKSIISKQ